MFNKLKLVALLMIPAMAAGAKDGSQSGFRENLKECVTVKKANEGWFIGPAIGTQLYVGDSDNLHPLGYRLTTALEGHLGKWITPAIALRLRGTGARITGGNLSSNRNAMNMAFISADCMFDALSLLAGMNEERKVTVLPFIGVGAGMNIDIKEVSPSLTVGAQVLFRVSERINMFTELKGTLLNDKMDGSATGFPYDGSAVLNAGFQFKF